VISTRKTKYLGETTGPGFDGKTGKRAGFDSRSMSHGAPETRVCARLWLAGLFARPDGDGGTGRRSMKSVLPTVLRTSGLGDGAVGVKVDGADRHYLSEAPAVGVRDVHHGRASRVHVVPDQFETGEGRI